MGLTIDGVGIESRLIIEEMERLRPDYREVFKEQSVEEQESQLLDWARENVVERFLFLRFAQEETPLVPVERIEEAYNHFVTRHPEAFVDEAAVKKELEHQLQVEQVVQKITAHISDSDTPDAEDRRNHAVEDFVDGLKEKSAISFEMDEELDALLKSSLGQEDHSDSMETAETAETAEDWKKKRTG